MHWRSLVAGILMTLLPVATSAQQTVPGQMNYQGRLLDGQGQALPDGDYTVTFRIYDRAQPASDETLVWGPQVFDGVGDASTGHGPRVALAGGAFNVNIGLKDEQDRALNTAFTGESRFIEIQIGDSAPILPRQQVLTAPFAFEARHADTAGHAVTADASTTSTTAASANTVKGVDIIDEATQTLIPSVVAVSSISATAIVADNSIQASQLATGAVGSDEIEDGSIAAADISMGVIHGIVPPGTVVVYMGDVAPEGWELCHGQAVSRTDPKYVALEAVIGDDRFGISSIPQTHFRLPDLRGFFLRGVDGPDGTSADRDPDSEASSNNGADGKRFAIGPGGATGKAVGSVQIDAFKRHDHETTVMVADNNIDGVDSTTTHSGEHHNESASTTLTGADENRPINIYVNYIIKL